MSFASVGVPFMLKNIGFQTISKQLFDYSKNAGDRVLVIIRLNGGNDGLNTVIPLDMYDNLVIQRSNVLIPQGNILPVTATIGFHPQMSGLKSVYDDGRLSVIQNVGYPEQNRSHFRSMDIWSTGSLDINETKGWLGRHFDNEYPNFPSDYPSVEYPDPFAISMGYELSSTCQGLMANFSHAVNDPFATYNLPPGSATNDGTYFGDHMEYITTLIDQTNEYGDQINTAANTGNTLSTLYDDNNPIAVQLRYVAQMISGGLQTKIYVLNINGFDTHDAQVISDDTTTGVHANLLKTLSDAVYAFMDDLKLLGIDNRVAGMTFSEFGRQVASNASLGTDHGDAAPMFLFGTCINAGVIGPNPVIGNTIINQEALPMQVDFRDVYASILKDWFEVPDANIQPLFEHTVTYYNILNSCNTGLDEKENNKSALLLYPNPAVSKTTIRFECLNEWVKIELHDMQGRILSTICDSNISQGTHDIPFETVSLAPGNYLVIVKKKSGMEKIILLKSK